MKRKGKLNGGIQSKISHYVKSDTISVRLSKIEILEGLVKLVTVDGRPFCSVEDDGLHAAFGPVFDKLDFSVDRHNISDLVRVAAEFVVDEIKSHLQNTLISVKVDCATRLHKSFFGLNVQVNLHIFSKMKNP